MHGRLHAWGAAGWRALTRSTDPFWQCSAAMYCDSRSAICALHGTCTFQGEPTCSMHQAGMLLPMHAGQTYQLLHLAQLSIQLPPERRVLVQQRRRHGCWTQREWRRAARAGNSLFKV
jgi:hypothetical protein